MIGKHVTVKGSAYCGRVVELDAANRVVVVDVWLAWDPTWTVVARAAYTLDELEVHDEGAPSPLEKLKAALGQIAELGDKCEECDPSKAPLASHVTAHPMSGTPIFLCDKHAKETAEAYRKAKSKGCGEQPEIEEHEQETAVTIAIRALRDVGAIA